MNWRAHPAIRLATAPAEVGMQLCSVRLRVCFEAFPSFVALAPLRVIGNAWPHEPAHGGTPGRCFGMAMRGDDLCHYFACPRMRAFVVQSRAWTPCWAHEGQMRLALFVVAATLRDSGVVAASMYCSARTRGAIPRTNSV